MVVNLLTPKSDQHLISPNNITPESHIYVTRRKEMIITKRSCQLSAVMLNKNMHADVRVSRV